MSLQWIKENKLTDIPEIVYRYDAFDIAIDNILGQQTLLLRPPSTFNDPFDLHDGLLDLTISNNSARKYASKLKGLRDTKLTERELALLLRKNKQKYAQHMLQNIRAKKEEVGITCFSATAFHPLLWAHYGEKHNGICIGFSRDLFIGQSMPMSIGRVIYTNDIVPKSYYKEGEGALLNWVYTKSNVWSYEEEIRLFSPTYNGPLSFEPSGVKEILFGCRIKQDVIEETIKKVNVLYKNVSYKRICLKKKTFELEAVML
jgi:hypothetical protein